MVNKKITLIVLGLAILLLLSFLPSNTSYSENVLGTSDNYAISVPAKPPKPPER